VSTKRHRIEVAGIPVEVVRKDIKNLHVYPPEGCVRIAVPPRLDDQAVRLAVIGRLRWIRRQQADFARQEHQPERRMITGCVPRPSADRGLQRP
jgi:predicted metal-dependent hydrolase